MSDFREVAKPMLDNVIENYSLEQISEALDETFDDMYCINLKQIDFDTQQNDKIITFYASTYTGEPVEICHNTKYFTAVDPSKDIAVQYFDCANKWLCISSLRILKEELVEWFFDMEEVETFLEILQENNEGILMCEDIEVKMAKALFEFEKRYDISEEED